VNCAVTEAGGAASSQYRCERRTTVWRCGFATPIRGRTPATMPEDVIRVENLPERCGISGAEIRENFEEIVGLAPRRIRLSRVTGRHGVGGSVPVEGLADAGREVDLGVPAASVELADVEKLLRSAVESGGVGYKAHFKTDDQREPRTAADACKSANAGLARQKILTGCKTFGFRSAAMGTARPARQ
jgi:hypothetical protein